VNINKRGEFFMTKKIVFSFIMIFTLMISIIPATDVSASDTWNLVWSDEFNGSSLNASNWICETGTGSGGWGNNELQYYTNRSDNVRVQDGSLIIEAKKESYSGMNYTSARIKTQGLRQFTYGKVEARIKLPKGQGIWPAFWMLGSNISQVSWPKCGEIDIMEHVNNEANTHGTIHWFADQYAYYGGKSSSIDVTQYHLYSIEWNANSIKWFVDGNQYWEANIKNSINGTEEFHKPYFLLLNLAVGGNWPGSPDSTTQFPAKMNVDYVRVYQQETSGESGSSSEKLSSATWYLFNQAETSTNASSQNLQTIKSGVTGWQPTKTISTAPNYWTSETINGTYSSGTWQFILWTNNPGADSNVTVDLYKVNADGSSQKLIGSKTINVSKSGTGNHTSTYSYSLNEAAFNNQRLMIKVYKASGADATMCYNTNDFPTRLVTP
jgi:beta-glucanase (GH16 family)